MIDTKTNMDAAKLCGLKPFLWTGTDIRGLEDEDFDGLDLVAVNTAIKTARIFNIEFAEDERDVTIVLAENHGIEIRCTRKYYTGARWYVSWNDISHNAVVGMDDGLSRIQAVALAVKLLSDELNKK